MTLNATRTRFARLRVLPALALAATAIATSGCSEIWSEIGGPDSGATAPGPDADSPNPESPEAKIQKYYADQRREKRAEVDPSNAIVSCEVDGRLTMTRRFDCQARGGRVR